MLQTSCLCIDSDTILYKLQRGWARPAPVGFSPLRPIGGFAIPSAPASATFGRRQLLQTATCADGSEVGLGFARQLSAPTGNVLHLHIGAEWQVSNQGHNKRPHRSGAKSYGWKSPVEYGGRRLFSAGSGPKVRRCADL